MIDVSDDPYMGSSKSPTRARICSVNAVSQDMAKRWETVHNGPECLKLIPENEF